MGNTVSKKRRSGSNFGTLKDILPVPVYDHPTGRRMDTNTREALIPCKDTEGNRYGLIPGSKLQESSSDSMKEYVYGLRTVFDSEKFPEAKGHEFIGTAIYVGMGYFVTCAHNVAHPGNGDLPRYTRLRVYITFPQSDIPDTIGIKEIEVDFKGSAIAGDPQNELFIDNIKSPNAKDLAILRVREHDKHHFENIPILKPALLDDNGKVTLTAINGPCAYTLDEIHRYADYCAPQADNFKEAVKQLRPGFVTEWVADRVESAPRRKFWDGSSPPVVSYQISTTPGSSGSLLSQNGKFVAVHSCGPEQPIDELSCNRGILIGTKTAKTFFKQYLKELIDNDPTWKEFVTAK
ncbi:hypothetical protein BJ508DRAFT_419221 [Ascobolus immersus RN42]|uniref:Trypsin-like serine protease n=1 Tax=Ascobolus immersus RN42 TaxID=1160509 RepID=A0A3N4HTC3_ASCIM|nr:hypothetical protein BJ508DRAFT_419221 [Ascobolus immersus RN42]